MVLQVDAGDLAAGDRCCWCLSELRPEILFRGYLELKNLEARGKPKEACIARKPGNCWKQVGAEGANSWS